MRALRAGRRFVALALLLSMSIVPAAAAEYTAFLTSSGPVNSDTATTARGEAVVDSRSYSYTDGSRLSMQRLRTNAAGAPAQELGKMTVSGTSGLLRWYDSKEAAWHVVQLGAGTYPVGTYHISTDKGSAIIVPPQVYLDHSNGMIEHLPAYNGSMVISPVQDGFLITLKTPALPANVHAEWFLVRSNGQLVDWNNAESAPKWSIYSFTGDNRWCMTGYYYLAPNSYYPWGENYYNNLPAAYIAGRMMRDDNQPGSMILGLAMLDVMTRQRNEEGYLPSLAGSTWLHDEYNVEPGYFDTRFNVDFSTAQMNAVKRYSITQWNNDLIRFGDYLCNYSTRHHFVANATGSREGWLVQDYAHANGNKPTHASLNHQAASAVFLYRLAALTKLPRFSEMAETLTRGIENTAALWLKEDGDLHYAYMPNGKYERTDYPYLTYNDLLELQQEIMAARGTPSAAIQTLIDSKLKWMNAHGVTGYNQ